MRGGARVAGGLISGLDHFGVAIERLLADAEARRRLGAAGREHWSAQFTHDAVVDRYDVLLRGAGALPAASAPRAAREATAAERAVFYDAAAASLAEPAPVVEAPAADSTPYSGEFFDALQQGALRSARAMLPVVFDALSPRSVLDVGCGAGAWLSICAELGAEEIAGVDGDYVDRNRLAIPAAAFTAADLEASLDLGRRFDLVMSLEVAEHLPPSAADAFVASLARHGDVVLFSAAIPNQGGVNHVNEQWPSYWAQRFAAHDMVAVDALRPRFWMHPAVEPWYAQNVLLFVAEHRLAELGDFAAAAADAGGPLALVHPRIFDARAERVATAPAPVVDGAHTDLLIVADAAEAAQDTSLLKAYAGTFGSGEATLVLYAPGGNAQQVAAGLAPSLAAAGMDSDDGPEAILLCVPEIEGDALLRDRAVVTLGRGDALARFDGAPHLDAEAAAAA